MRPSPSSLILHLVLDDERATELGRNRTDGRFPRAVLGLPYDCSLDVWSIACTLYELYTGK